MDGVSATSQTPRGQSAGRRRDRQHRLTVSGTTGIQTHVCRPQSRSPSALPTVHSARDTMLLLTCTRLLQAPQHPTRWGVSIILNSPERDLRPERWLACWVHLGSCRQSLVSARQRCPLHSLGLLGLVYTGVSALGP